MTGVLPGTTAHGTCRWFIFCHDLVWRREGLDYENMLGTLKDGEEYVRLIDKFSMMNVEMYR